MSPAAPLHRRFDRRQLLRASGGICLTLPMLESFARGDESPPIRRLVCVANPFGMIADAFFPTEAERDAALPRNLQPLDGLRGQFTVFSNLDHGIGGGHAGTHTFLSGVRMNEAAGMPNGNITLDQFCGEATAGATRFPVLNASAGSDSGGGCELSWTRSGVLVPPIQKVSRVFQMLFIDDPPGLGQERSARYDRQGSILDTVNDQAQAMQGRLSHADRLKLDQYFTSIREVERGLEREQAWLGRPRPKVDMKEPRDGPVTQQLPILYDLITLALQTDSTRVVTIDVPGSFDTVGIGLGEKGYHGFSHHGKEPALMAGMRKIEQYQIEQLARFMRKLNELRLLDDTQILFGSGMGDGSAHTNKNLPILVAGGGFKHRTHVKLPEEQGRRIPLCNLYLSMAQRFGVETDKFGYSTSTFSELV
ncbi:MAG TPA: DUF1552 domain-containing protein [Pirellulales bacterium]|jgi:hypothetical protein|nr:DUF1552 domain-containing protein [Pirellulales bacterium]